MAQTEKMLQFSNVEIYYCHGYALKGVSSELKGGESVGRVGGRGGEGSSSSGARTKGPGS